MLVTLAIWLIATIVSFSYGLLIERLTGLGEDQDSLTEYFSRIMILVLIGFTAVNILASILSLFIPLRLEAFLIVVIPPIAYLLFFHRPRFKLDFNVLEEQNSVAFFLASLSMMLLLVWITSGPAQNADTYIYHAQSIRWIEEYPIIKGLGNFFIRLAYNSSWFVQSAFFSFSFLGGRSYHVLNGLVIFWISLFFLRDFFQFASDKSTLFLQHLALLLISIGFITIGSQSSAPSTDLPVAYFGWLVVYLCIRSGNDADSRSGLMIRLLAISGLAAFAFTIKIYALPLLLFPLLFIFANRHFIPRSIIIILAIWVLLIILPWITRNIIISGYAIYPLRFTAVPVQWRMPEEIIEMDLSGIRSWGFNNSLPPEATDPLNFSEQLQFWFQQLTNNQRLLFFVALFFPINAGLFLHFSPIDSLAEGRIRGLKYFLAFYAGFLFWLATSPNLRFGYVYLLFFFAATIAMATSMIVHLTGISDKMIGFFGLYGFLIFHVVFIFISYDAMNYKDRLFMPMDYDKRFVNPCVINGGKTEIWCASFYSECGYHYFPCHAWGTDLVFLYGNDFRDGFYYALPDELR